MAAAHFYALADGLTQLKMYPVFDAVHFALMCMTAREDVQQQLQGSYTFAKKHPLSSWVSSMLLCFAGGIIFNLLFGKPLVTVLQNHESLLIATGIWYLINYCPGDLVYVVLRWTPIKMVLVAIKEVHRVYGVNEAVRTAIKLYPGSYVIQVVAGLSKGCGALFLTNFSQLLRGFWVPSKNELLAPSFITKASLASSVLFILEDTRMLQLEHRILFAVIILVLIYIRLTTILLNTRDPFVPFENLLSAILFGGMWDALKRVTGQDSPAVVTTDGTAKKNS